MSPKLQIRKSKPDRLGNKSADHFRFKSSAQQPIRELSVLGRSLLMAESCLISYLPIEQCNIAAGRMGFSKGKFFDCDGAQAYWFQSDHDSVVVCRGTEPHEWNDIEADANALTAVAETVGRVHRGFKREADDLWPYLEKELEPNEKPLWFCGHSLGGAIALICAARCLLSFIKSEPEELYTFGSPKVGNRNYVNHAPLRHYRWVNNNDIVTRVPPTFFGYSHVGTEIYVNHFGRIAKIKGWRRIADRIRGFAQGLLHWRVDQLSDHSIIDYIDVIFEAIRQQEASCRKQVQHAK